ELVNYAFTGQRYARADATALGTRFVLSNDPSIDGFRQFVLEGIAADGQIEPAGADAWKGERSALGLTEKGRSLIQGLMARHLIVDIDHMSYAAANEVLDMGKQAGNYPFVSSHSTFDELAFSGDGRFDPNDPAKNFQTFATTQPQNLSHEGMRSTSQVKAIKE